MSSYVYRDARRQQLSNAILALAGGQPEISILLEKELAELQSDGWEVMDRTYLAVAADWLWTIHSPATLKALMADDPVLAAFSTPSKLSDAQASIIMGISQVAGRPPPDYLDQVHSATGTDDAAFNELIYAAHRHWALLPGTEQPYPFDDVGVLLPLRLETLFDEPNTRYNDDPSRWKLSLRVVPDEASICRDNAYVSEDESKVLVAFWQAIKQPGDLSESWLDGGAAEIAWKQLCNRITQARAAWLVATITARPDGDTFVLELPANLREATPNRVGGLPPELHVFAVAPTQASGVTKYAIGRLPVDEAKYIDTRALTLPLPSKQEEKDSWWASWDKAKAVGLGGEWLLPEGLTAQSIQALYVVGIGDETPDAHFKAQVDAGELAILRLGAPTNTVQGKAADLGNQTDWRKVAQMRLHQRLNIEQNPASYAAHMLQQQITGDANSLPFFPGADGGNDAEESHRMVQALWPALWGNWLHDLWQVGEEAFRSGLWAFEHLYPEGPLAPVRIGDQPYGLLPVTALSQWEVDAASDPDEVEQRRVEMSMASALNDLRSQWGIEGSEQRCVVGKSTSQFLDLLGREALSNNYIWRQFAPASTQVVLYNLDQQLRKEFGERALGAYRLASKLMGREPPVPYLATSYWDKNMLPLVQPTRMMYRHLDRGEVEPVPLAHFLSLLFSFQQGNDIQNYDLDKIFERPWELDGHNEYQLSTLPDSLLIRLLVYACQVASQWSSTLGDSQLGKGLLDIQQKAALEVARMIDDPAWLNKEQDPFNGRMVFTLKIPEERRTQLERALRATLDSAAHRIDPWITGFAQQRLRQHSSSERHAHRLGAYGWVEGPFIGAPGPTDAGRLHTPSYNQTLAALIFRDKFLSSKRAMTTSDSGHNPWEMNITSSKVRLAEEIADEVRLGFHIYEIVGRHVENVLGAHQTVKELRTSNRYAMHPERKDPNEVCNGIEALPALLVGDPGFPLNANQQRALQLLADALDAYGDLLMAEGVLQLVNRQVERAAETMDAAAGFSRPPSFDFIRTPPSGYQLESVVLSTLPYVPLESLAQDANPGRLADPSVAAFIESRLGSNWTWHAVNVDSNAMLGTISLAEMRLTPSDTLAFSDELLRELARRKLRLPLAYISERRNRAWLAKDAQNDATGSATLIELSLTPEALAGLDDTTLHDRVRSSLGMSTDTAVEEMLLADPRLWVVQDENGALLGMASPHSLGLTAAEIDALPLPELHRRVRLQVNVPQVRIDAPRQYQLAHQFVAALGSRPASGRDFSNNQSAQSVRSADAYGELRARYVRLYAACRQMIQDLRGATDDIQRAGALRRAAGWGVAPMGEPAQREALLAAISGIEPPAQAAPLATLIELAAQMLEKRLADAPSPDDLATEAQIASPLPDEGTRKGKQLPDGVPTMARAIANLALPNGKLAILACWRKDDLVLNTKLVTEQTQQSLDEEWLTIVATTRGNLARLEAVQLEIDTPMDAWTSSPGDPWQTAPVKSNLEKRGTDLLGIVLPRFVAAYGSTEAWAGQKVAVGLIDAFSEAIPMPQRTTMSAFGFNAPSARAPQAILLAVPPKPRQRLDAGLLLQIAEETRQLARARTAHVEDLGYLQAMVPTMWLQSSGPVRVRLEGWPLFE